MSIFSNIMSAIFKSASPTGAAPSAAAPSAAPAGTSAAPKAQVDVAAVLTKLAEQNREKLDWRRSIVDLMKLLNLDSSLAARKQLAQELHYTGDQSDSASMNVWLHKQVMQKLAENGGEESREGKPDQSSGELRAVGQAVHRPSGIPRWRGSPAPITQSVRAIAQGHG